MPKPSVEQIDCLLPQTQCTKCGYPSCKSYAQAIASSDAAINRCSPGGDSTIYNLATLLSLPPIPLDPRFGSPYSPQLAFIEEENCIGCTLCIRACPVDAIIGAAKQMHTVITAECTGCELCLDSCPVDCIKLVVDNSYTAIHLTLLPKISDARAKRARERYTKRLERLDRQKTIKTLSNTRAEMKREIMESVQRIRNKKQQTNFSN